MLCEFLRFTFRHTLPGRNTIFRLVRFVLAMVRGNDGTIRFDTLLKGRKLLLNLCLSDYIDSEVVKNGYYEHHILEELLTASENGVVWDIGANIGLHTAAVALSRPDIDVVSVEANPLLAKRLLANVSSYQNVKVYLCGLSLRYELLPFSILSGHSGLSSFTPWGDVSYDRVVYVSTMPASDLPSAVPEIVKIDVEGYELTVLQGFGMLMRDVMKYIIETSNPESVLNMLGRDKFTYRQIGPSDKPDFVFEKLPR